VKFFNPAGLHMSRDHNDSRDRELAIVRFQRNAALLCIGAIVVFVLILTGV
jgi:hypothetical protein